MKANQETLSISPMDLENLTAGAAWTDGDDIGYVLALANRNVPKSRRALFPLSVIYTSNFVDVFSIPVDAFLKNMKFVEVSAETQGYIQSMMLALAAHKEVGSIQEGDINPGLVFPQGTEASAPHHVHAQQEAQEELGNGTAADVVGSPVELLFTDKVSALASQAINSELVSLIENPYDNTVELMFRNVNQDLLHHALEHIVHIDTEDGVYAGNTLVLAGVRRAYITEGRNLRSAVAVVFAISGDDAEDEEDSKTEAAEPGPAVAEEVLHNPNVAGGAQARSEYDKAMTASITPGNPASGPQHAV